MYARQGHTLQVKKMPRGSSSISLQVPAFHLPEFYAEFCQFINLHYSLALGRGGWIIKPTGILHTDTEK